MSARRTRLAQARQLHVLCHDPLQAELEHKQAVLGRIVDMGAELFAIACAGRDRSEAAPRRHT